MDCSAGDLGWWLRMNQCRFKKKKILLVLRSFHFSNSLFITLPRWCQLFVQTAGHVLRRNVIIKKEWFKIPLAVSCTANVMLILSVIISRHSWRTTDIHQKPCKLTHWLQMLMIAFLHDYALFPLSSSVMLVDICVAQKWGLHHYPNAAKLRWPTCHYERFGNKIPEGEHHLVFIFCLFFYTNPFNGIYMWLVDAGPTGRFLGLRLVRSMNRSRWPCSTHPVWRKMELLWPWMHLSSKTANWVK